MHKGADFRHSPKPLMVKPNFTVNSMETRFNRAVTNSAGTIGSNIPNREQHQNSYSEAPTCRFLPNKRPAEPCVLLKPGVQKLISAPQGADDCRVPERKPLPSGLALGKCPAKPKRPVHVNLNKFRGNAHSSAFNTNNPEQDFLLPPPPPPDYPSVTSMTPPPPENFTFLPAPPTMDESLQEDLYDDADSVNRENTPLGKSMDDPEESNEETYDDIDHSRSESNKDERDEKKTKELKKRLEKEEKKRLEQEKKEKKEREKRMQEARKKFKIMGPIEVIDTVKVKVDHKGGKYKLPLQQGETIEIVRKMENPKDYWLARNSEGHYGFVKPDTLDVVCGEVRLKQDGQEVYDDVDANDKVNNPPDATEFHEDIYECPEDPQTDFSFPPPPVDANDDTYDDVIPSDFPPPPSPNSIPRFGSTSKVDELDPKKKKKFEKEEKEFRKKFKYNAEIKVLYQATVSPSLSMKKFGNKDLPVKPREMIDVIVEAVDGKLIGRNSEGKLGYVFTANLEADESVYEVGEEDFYTCD